MIAIVAALSLAACDRTKQAPSDRFEVTARYPTVRVELNGTLITDADLSKVTEFMANRPHPGKDRTTGHFGFLGHNDPVAFRNVQIKKLKGPDQ